MKKLFCILIALSLCFSISAFDASSVTDVKDVVSDYTKGLVSAIPTEVSADNIWADAYIGQLIGVPPHFAIGFNMGGAFIKNDSIMNNFKKLVGTDIGFLPGVPVPSASFNGRIGGIILPFDVGFHGMFTNLNMSSLGGDGNIKINTWGIDFRYKLLSQVVVIPCVSVGLGFDHVGVNVDLNVPNSPVGFNFLTKGNMLSTTAEASWSFIFIKLFGGARAILPLGEGITAKGSVSSGSTSYEVSSTNSALSFQLFGGLAFRALLVDTTFGVTYDVAKSNLGASMSVRFQL